MRYFSFVYFIYVFFNFFFIGCIPKTNEVSRSNFLECLNNKDTSKTHFGIGCGNYIIYGVIDTNLFYELTIQSKVVGIECKKFNQDDITCQLMIHYYTKMSANEKFIFYSKCSDVIIENKPILINPGQFQINISIKKNELDNSLKANLILDFLKFNFNNKNYEFKNLIYYNIQIDTDFLGFESFLDENVYHV